MDLFHDVMKFKSALFAAEQQLAAPVGWSMEFGPVVAPDSCGCLRTWPEGMVLRRGGREVVVVLTRYLTAWARSLN